MTDKSEYILELSALSKSFSVGTQEVQVLKDVNITIKWGDFVVIIGPSGSGKSTILYSLLGLEVPTSGNVRFIGEDIYDNTDEDFRSDLRKNHIGMVYQQANWIKALTVRENVAFPMLLQGKTETESYTRSIDLLTQVGMAEWAEYRPSELSGGQQQRVAVARALINDPKLIVADEPTGNLDYQNGQNIMTLLSQLNQKDQKTIIMVTHDLEYLSFAKTAIHIFDGQVAGVYTDEGQKQLLSNIKGKKGVQLPSEEFSKSHQASVDKSSDAKVSNQTTKHEDQNSPTQAVSGE